MNPRFLRIVLTSSLLALTLSARTDAGIAVNGKDISTGSGADWICSGGTNLVLSGTGPYVINGNNNGATVTIVAATDCEVIASNLVIDASGTGDPDREVDGTPAFDCGTNAVTLALWSDAGTTNIFKGGYDCAGIRTTKGSLTITNLNEAAVLSVSGGKWGAGIGGGDGGAGGTVRISGGTVFAQGTSGPGGVLGADIGNGARATGGVNLFTGGSVCLVSGSVSLAPSNGTERVWCVTNGGFVANARAVVSGLPTTYGTSDLFADASGKVNLWLPAGDYAAVGSSADGATANTVLKAFAVSATGTVAGPTNAVLTITGYDAATSAMTHSPEALPNTALTTIYSTNLADWAESAPENAGTLFRRLKIK